MHHYPTKNSADITPPGFPMAVLHQNKWWWAVAYEGSNLRLERYTKNRTETALVDEDEVQGKI